MPDNCSCNYSLYKFNDSSCSGCSYIQRGVRSAAKPTQKQIWGQTGISGSLYSMNLSSLTVSSQRIHSGKDVNWNQMSDRQLPGVQRAAIPSHGSSTRGNVTRMRPGSLAPSGIGVDIKCGSYARYLYLKKSYNLKQGIVPTIGAVKPITGNKTYATNALAQSDECVCIDPLLSFNPATTILVYNSNQGVSSFIWGGVTFRLDANLPNHSYTVTVPSIPTGPFPYINNLISVKIGSSVTSIGENAFAFCGGLTSVTIGSSVTSIGESAFQYCQGLTTVTIPNSVTSIGNGAFAVCSGLTTVTLGSSVASIGKEAFAHCSGLTSITIPISVTSIGVDAFLSSGVTTVTITNGQLGITSPTTNPPGVIFYGVTVATI